ncbi:MAG: glycosyltransferase family 39 protein [Victivallaceae bacterium]
MKHHFLIPLAALILYSALFWYRAERSEMFSRDGYIYCKVIDIWARSGADAAYSSMAEDLDCGPGIPPLMMAGSAQFMRLGADVETAILLYNYCCGFLFVLGGWLAGKALAGERKWEPVVTVFACAILPSFIRISADLLRDGSYLSYLMFGLGALLYATGSERAWRWWAMLGGLSATAAMFTRREGGELIAAVGIWSLWELALAYRRKDIRTNRVLRCVLYFFSAVVVAGGSGWYIVSRVPSCQWQLIPLQKASYVIEHLLGRLW